MCVCKCGEPLNYHMALLYSAQTTASLLALDTSFSWMSKNASNLSIWQAVCIVLWFATLNFRQSFLQRDK